MSSQSPELVLTLDDAVQEVLGQLNGLDLTYEPELDTYRAITRCLNRALRANALEHEWSWYSSTESLGAAAVGVTEIELDPTLRPRVINDDAVRLVDDDGNPVLWAYFLPRDALHKYAYQPGYWCSVTRTTLMFNKSFTDEMVGLDIRIPVMREPTMFRLPAQTDPPTTVPTETRDQPIDFAYPDIIVARAAFYYAQTDPVMQPRVQSLEGYYKDLMYQAIERDDRNTDTPYENSFIVPVQSGIYRESTARPWPLADRRH
jgi:hypothetical protein